MFVGGDKSSYCTIMKLLRSSGYPFHLNFLGDEKKTSTTTNQKGEKIV